MPDPFKLKFNFDVSTIRLLGRELITDRITALFELVKNCYDANSDHVTLYLIMLVVWKMTVISVWKTMG